MGFIKSGFGAVKRVSKVVKEESDSTLSSERERCVPKRNAEELSLYDTNV